MFHRRRLLGSVRVPFVAAGGAAVTWTAVANPAVGTAGSTVTFVAVPLGVADATRGTVVVVSTESIIATSVTIGGVTMTKGIEEATAISSLQIWGLITSGLGTTADIVLTGSGAMTAPMIMVGRTTGINTMFSATSAVNNAGADPAQVTATVPSGGLGVAAIMSNPTNTGTWSNATVDYRTNVNSKTLSMAHTSSVGSQTMSYSGIGGVSHMVMATFSP